MTLDTRMYIHDQVDVHQFFHYFRELLGAGPEHPYKDELARYGDAGEWNIGNQIGIGLPALVSVHYRPGGSLRPDGDACSGFCDPPSDDNDEPYHHHEPAHWAKVSMDTAYGYRDEQGRGCGDLHACYVAQLGRWLDERGVAWSWENEFTGDVHGGVDRYLRLADLTKGGAAATTWFTNIVQPAIEAHGARST